MKRFSRLFAVAVLVAVGGGEAHAQIANLKVVTDASPDYSDMESMVRSITSNWQTDVVMEVQVLGGFEFKAFDMKLALPDAAQNGKAPPKPDMSPNAKQWKEGELPTTIGVPL